jgi:hypothetical protein
MRISKPLQYWAVVLSTILPYALAAYQQVDDSRCNCYLTNGSSGSYFTTHKFYDFRSMSQHVNIPSLISDPTASSQASPANDYFQSQDWTQAWGIQQWNNTVNLANGDANVFMVNSPSNVYFQKNTDSNPASDTFLTLRTARMDDFQSAAEIESIIQGVHFASVRMYARTIGDPGAITAMFTYRGSNNPNLIQESDLEIRTLDPPDVIHYTNQPSYNTTGGTVPQATRNASVPVGWNDWAVHRMDWTPTSTMWYVDGQNVSQISFQTPRDPSQVIFNAWSDGASWSGNMSVGAEAHLQIQWIELVLNVTSVNTTNSNRRRGELDELSGRDSSASCQNICSIDDTQKLGSPVLLQGTSNSARVNLPGQGGSFGNVGFWIPALIMALVGLLL